MDVKYHLNGTDYVWNDRKAAGNPGKHDGVAFEQAATVFFDPLFRLVDAGRGYHVTPSLASMPLGDCYL